MINILHTGLHTNIARQAIQLIICSEHPLYSPVQILLDKNEHIIARLESNDYCSCKKSLDLSSAGDYIQEMDCIRGIDNEVLVIYERSDTHQPYTVNETNKHLLEQITECLEKLLECLQRKVKPDQPFYILEEHFNTKTIRSYLQAFRLSPENPFESDDPAAARKECYTLEKLSKVLQLLKNRESDEEDAILDPLLLESRRMILKNLLADSLEFDHLIELELKTHWGYIGAATSLIPSLPWRKESLKQMLLKENPEKQKEIEAYFSSESFARLVKTIEFLKADQMLKLPSLTFILAHRSWYGAIVNS